MIRDFNIGDKEELVKIIKQGIVIGEQDIINCLSDKDIKIIVYANDQAEIQGFSYLKIWDKDGKKGNIRTYVVPSARRKGIGALLYNEIMKYEDEFKLNCICTRFRFDEDDATLLYKKLGYEKWYGEHDLYYNGVEQPKSDFQFETYDNKYFEQYAEGLRKSFYELRKIHNFQPHLCCELNEKKREEFLKNKDHIYLLLNSEEVIASVIIYDDGCLDDVFVIPSYQGKGYGKVITQFAINEALKKDTNKIKISAIEWNIRALNLYQSLGFSIVQTTHYYRLLR